MDATKREIRNLECQLAFREASGEASEAGILGTICGRAICFNSESQVLDEYGQTFREVIAPEAATMDYSGGEPARVLRRVLYVPQYALCRTVALSSGYERR